MINITSKDDRLTVFVTNLFVLTVIMNDRDVYFSLLDTKNELCTDRDRVHAFDCLSELHGG